MTTGRGTVVWRGRPTILMCSRYARPRSETSSPPCFFRKAYPCWWQGTRWGEPSTATTTVTVRTTRSRGWTGPWPNATRAWSSSPHSCPPSAGNTPCSAAGDSSRVTRFAARALVRAPAQAQVRNPARHPVRRLPRAVAPGSRSPTPGSHSRTSSGCFRTAPRCQMPTGSSAWRGRSGCSSTATAYPTATTAARPLSTSRSCCSSTRTSSRSDSGYRRRTSAPAGRSSSIPGYPARS